MLQRGRAAAAGAATMPCLLSAQAPGGFPPDTRLSPSLNRTSSPSLYLSWRLTSFAAVPSLGSWRRPGGAPPAKRGPTARGIDLGSSHLAGCDAQGGVGGPAPDAPAKLRPCLSVQALRAITAPTATAYSGGEPAGRTRNGTARGAPPTLCRLLAQLGSDLGLDFGLLPPHTAPHQR